MYRHGPSCRGGIPARQRVRWKKSRPEMTLRKTQENAPPSPNDPPIRLDLVRRVRQAIAEGAYETPERWQGALERLMDLL
jgi:hypothetical protein